VNALLVQQGGEPVDWALPGVPGVPAEAAEVAPAALE
jgi:hypothetical protein